MSQKITDLFATLRARYGQFELKDGQSLQAVMMSYKVALDAYHPQDLNSACLDWMNSSKYPRWPEPAELLERLKAFGAKPETKAVEMSPRVRAAQEDASRWYEGVVSRALPQGAWPLRWEDAVLHVIGTDRADWRGKSFGWMLTRAWLDGVIPAGFDEKARAYFEDASRRKALYLNAVRTHGAAAVHEGRVTITPPC